MLRPTSDAERGSTMVELMVVLVLMGVIGSIVTGAVVSSLTTSRQADSRMSAMSDLQRGIERVGRELRVADRLELDSNGDFAESIGARVYRGGQRVTYRYYIAEPDDGEGNPELREDVRRETVDGDLIEEQEGLFIADIANLETGTDLFTYYAVDPDTEELEELDCDAKGWSESECRVRHSTASQIRLRLEKLLPEQEPMRVETVVNIRNTRFETE